jgi:hypothetical protein
MFVITTVGCGRSHKDMKHTDKCSKNKTKKKKNTKTEY